MDDSLFKRRQQSSKDGRIILESNSGELIHWALRLFSYSQDKNILSRIEPLIYDKREKVKIDAGYSIKAIYSQNHLDFFPPYQSHPPILDNFNFENYKTEDEFKEAVDFFVSSPEFGPFES